MISQIIVALSMIGYPDNTLELRMNYDYNACITQEVVEQTRVSIQEHFVDYNLDELSCVYLGEANI